jgi:hypothetical protein
MPHQMSTDFDLRTVDKLLTTTRSVRKRLDLTRSVELEIIEECLDLDVHFVSPVPVYCLYPVGATGRLPLL